MALMKSARADRRIEAAVVFTILALAAASRAQIAAAPQPKPCILAAARHPSSKSHQDRVLPLWVLALIPPPPQA